MRRRRPFRPAWMFTLATLLALTTPALATPPTGRGAATTASVSRLLEEMGALMDEVSTLRERLAAARLEAADAQRELAELRQFIQDHEELGADFQQYRVVKAAAEEEARIRATEARRQQREEARQERLARYRAARAERDRANAESDRIDRYKRAGFGGIGLDVFTGRMAYAYQTVERDPARVDYDPFIGLYYRPSGPTVDIDYHKMTISGSVLNAATTIRNIGVAITFFDEQGNQVGGEIVQINNARPDVPYPFTSTVDMALNRPFASSSTYVLYADRVETPGN